MKRYHPSTDTTPIRTIAVLVGTDVLGDGLIKLPFLQALKASWPKAEIHWITSQGPSVYAGILRDLAQPLLAAVHETPPWLPTQKNPHDHVSGAPFFDLILDTRNRWRQELLARKLPHHIFIGLSWRYMFSDYRPPLFSKKPEHIIDRLLQMIQVVHGASASATIKFQPLRLNLPEHLRARATQLLPNGNGYVGLAPGAGNAIKCWPLENFIAVAQHVAQHMVDMGKIPVFILGPAEKDWKEKISAAVPQALFPLQEKWEENSNMPPLFATLAVGERLDMAVVNDSGTSHMLAAVNCPLISLFGPTRAEKLAPRVSRSVVLRAQDYGGQDMEKIPVDDVLKVLM